MGHTDDVGIMMHVEADGGGGALELALDARENRSHGGGWGEGHSVITVNVVVGGSGGDRGSVILA
jgi:hypothetical protein